jgi:hypothetical protein
MSGDSMASGGVLTISTSCLSPRCPATMMSKPLVGLDPTRIRSAVSTFNTASLLRHATMRTVCRNCILTHRGITYDRLPWTRLTSFSPSWNATRIETERIYLDWRALVMLMQSYCRHGTSKRYVLIC